MITENDANMVLSAITRTGLNFPPERKGFLALAVMLARHTLSFEHAKAVVDSWIAHYPHWPKPSDIRQMCLNVSDPLTIQRLAETKKCEYCHGDGFISADAQFGLSGAVKCTHGPEMEEISGCNLKISRSMESHYMAELREADPIRAVREGTSGHVDLGEIRRILEEQEAARNPKAAEELARQLGTVK